jgi:enediyne biosynthesis protein E5
VRSWYFGTSWIVPLTPMTSAAFMVFTLYMIPDPATTPVKPLRQALFGTAIAAVYGVLLVEHVVYGLFIALTIVSAMRGVGLYAWAAWNLIRAKEREPVSLQPGIAGTAKGMQAG